MVREHPDPYLVLGVSPTATAAEITHAYRTRLRAHHPDTRHTPPEVAAKAWQICRLIQHETGTTLGSTIEVLNVADGGLMPPPEDL